MGRPTVRISGARPRGAGLEQVHEEYSQGGSQTPWSVGLKGQVEDQMGPRHQAWAAGARCSGCCAFEEGSEGAADEAETSRQFISLSHVEFESLHKGCSQCKYLKGKRKCGLRAQERLCPGTRERARPQQRVGWCRGGAEVETEARWRPEEQGGH